MKKTKPERYDMARIRTLATPSIDKEALASLTTWLHERRKELQVVMPESDREVQCYFWMMDGVEDAWDASHLLRQALVENLEVTAKAWGVDGGLGHTTMTARMFHHDNHQSWNYPSQDAWLGYKLFLFRHPKRFSGGAIEWMDGTCIEPRNGEMLLFDPSQAQRVRQVECWSPHVLDALWTIEGLVYAPEDDDRDQVEPEQVQVNQSAS